MLFAQQVYAAAQATVAWNPDTAQVAGYDVYYGTSSGNYTTTLNAGNNTSATLPNLSAQTYYIALTAYNSNNEQSSYSPELVVNSLSASAGSGGTISPSGTLFQSQGANQTFTITPSAGYKTASVLVDGTSVGAVASYTFSNISTNHTISATFAAGVTSYTITASAGANGTISPSGPVTVNSGASQTFAITANNGYQVSNVQVDGSSAGAVTTYTFSNVTANHTISATFTATTKTYTISASAGSNGAISPSGSVTVNSATSQAFAITPASGSQVTSVLVDGASVGAVISYTFSSVAANHTISATFTTKSRHRRRWGSTGSVSSSGSVAVSSGGSQASTISPITGSPVSSVLVDGLVADAGPDQTVAKGVKVTLNGSNSTDVGGPGIASYLWTQIGGTKVRLSHPSAAVTTLNAPARIGALTFQLTVKDVNGLQSTDTCIVNVASAKEAATAAIANAGPDQTVNEGTMITLDGSHSIDLNNGALSYLWQQIDGPAVTLSDPNSAQPAFAAPQVGSNAVSMRFRLTVTNKYGLKSTDTCFVNVTLADVGPQAVAGSTETEMAGSLVTLDGSRSAAPGCGIASYRWCQTKGSPVTLSVPTSVTPAFTARKAGAGHYGNQLTFMLIVEGTDGMRTRTTQVINVREDTSKESSTKLAF